MKKHSKSTHYVSPTDGGWTVSRPGSQAEIHESRESALKAARNNLRDKGGVIVEHTRRGSVNRIVIGHERIAKFAAVEGLSLTREMQNDLNDLERRRLTSDERSKEIARKYGKRAS
jgi:hypothetical protein